MEKQFDKLFKSNYARFVSIAYSYTKKRELAEEAVQDVFIDFWHRLEKKEAILNHEAYLRRAVVYRCLDTLKKERRYIDMEGDDLDIIVSRGTENNPESLILNKEKKEALNKAINKLPDRTREVFILSRFERHSHNEISENLEISKKTVEYHITKALTLLRETLISLTILLFSIIF